MPAAMVDCAALIDIVHSLRWNGVSASGASRLAEALAANKSLVQLECVLRRRCCARPPLTPNRSPVPRRIDARLPREAELTLEVNKLRAEMVSLRQELLPLVEQQRAEVAELHDALTDRRAAEREAAAREATARAALLAEALAADSLQALGGDAALSPELAQHWMRGIVSSGPKEWVLGREYELEGAEPVLRRSDAAVLLRIRHVRRPGRPLALKCYLALRGAAGEEPADTGDDWLCAKAALTRLPPHLHVVPVLYSFVGEASVLAPFARVPPGRQLAGRALCVVMPLLPTSLSDLARRVRAAGAGALGESKAAKLLLQLLLAVWHAQQQALTHNDIQPSTVLLDPHTWHLSLAGFQHATPLRSDAGTALTFTAQCMPHTLAPTAAPEIASCLAAVSSREGVVLERADVLSKADEYACAATLHRVLLGDDTDQPWPLSEGGSVTPPEVPREAYSPAFRALLRALAASNPGERLIAPHAALMLGVLLWNRGQLGAAGVAPEGAAEAASRAGLGGEHEAVDAVLQLQVHQLASSALGAELAPTARGVMACMAARLSALAGSA